MGIFDLFTLGTVPQIESVQAPKKSLYEIKINALDGSELSLSSFKGKKILFVNVASKCGFTYQYEELQKLSEQEKNTLVIIGLPCNQFGYQEKGNADEIQSFCSVNYGVTFPITEKIESKGSNQHPVYAWLTQRKLNGSIDSKVKWNFQKYLINEEGALQEIFSPKTDPLSDALLNAIKN